MKLSRKTFLAALGGLTSGAMAAYSRWIEPHRIEITHKHLRLPNLTSPLTLLHLSDFHHSSVVSMEFLADAIQQSIQHPFDLACITGDFYTRRLTQAKDYGKLIALLSQKAPTIACVGNHDGGRTLAAGPGYDHHELLRELLETNGASLLINQHLEIKINEAPLTLAGLGDLWARNTFPEQALHKTRIHPHPVITLCHNPDAKTLLAPYDWDLLLCGHTHGGQLVIPLLQTRPFLPIRDTRFAEGLHSWQNRWIHITRGIGNLHGVRFNCRPEISFLHLKP